MHSPLLVGGKDKNPREREGVTQEAKTSKLDSHFFFAKKRAVCEQRCFGDVLWFVFTDDA